MNTVSPQPPYKERLNFSYIAKIAKENNVMIEVVRNDITYRFNPRALKKDYSSQTSECVL